MSELYYISTDKTNKCLLFLNKLSKIAKENDQFAIKASDVNSIRSRFMVSTNIIRFACDLGFFQKMRPKTYILKYKKPFTKKEVNKIIEQENKYTRQFGVKLLTQYKSINKKRIQISLKHDKITNDTIINIRIKPIAIR